jgi:hypothetical protein
MVKTAALAFRMESEIKGALQKAADDERRSISSMVEIILSDWLTNNGYLSKPKRPGRR